MPAPNAIPGSRRPVFVGGIEYGSIYGAALETGISTVWLTKSIKKNNGAPVMVKNQMVVAQSWVCERLESREAIA
jgi:hypothetical protein